MSQDLYQEIKRYVLNNSFRAGEALSERKLAQRFGVSRSPVREVLKAMEQEGFIRVVPNRGAFLNTLTLDDIREILELREALDTFAIRRAALKLRSSELTALAKRFSSLARKRQKVSFKEMRDAWSALFEAVVASLNNKRFVKVYSDLYNQVEAVRRFSTSSPERIVEAVRLGLKLVRALMKRNPGGAEKVLRLHRQKSKEAIFKALSQ